MKKVVVDKKKKYEKSGKHKKFLNLNLGCSFLNQVQNYYNFVLDSFIDIGSKKKIA